MAAPLTLEEINGQLADAEREQDWREDADRLNRLCELQRQLGRTCPAPSKEEAEAEWNANRTDNAGPLDEPRDDGGRWTAGGGTTVERLKSAVAGGADADEVHHAVADHAVAELGKLSKDAVFRHLTEAGVEGARPHDSKKDMLQRARNRITAAARARARAEV